MSAFVKACEARIVLLRRKNFLKYMKHIEAIKEMIRSVSVTGEGTNGPVLNGEEYKKDLLRG